MALPELTKKQIEKTLDAYCRAKVPAGLHDRVRVGFKFRGNSATSFEERPAFGSPETWVEIVVAQFRFNLQKKEWTLYCADRNSRWHPYSEAEPSRNFEDLLKEVDEDPTGIFWG
jgi:hypothetical protein